MEGNEKQEEIKLLEENCYNEEYKTFPYERIIGVRNEERENFLMIGNRSFVSYSGMYLSIYQIEENRRNTIYSQDGGGIGAVAVHHSKTYLAIGERGLKPNIYIYDLSNMTLVSTLMNGTEKSYCSICFSKNSNKFVSVGSSPDYSIVVWDWKTGKTLLRAKAFSQDVHKVSFSDFSDDMICSSGMAHIKFWKIANTFTGLKLKGEIGKFGTIELSDISDFIHLSDGNVVSGSESGNLLLWEGNFIKNVIHQTENIPCHKGFISCVKLYKEKLIFTASSSDNVIKIWSAIDFKNVNNEEGLEAYFTPIKEIILEEDCGVLSIDISIIEFGYIFIQERHGHIYEIRLSEPSDNIECKMIARFQTKIKKIFDFSCDEINSMTLQKQNIVYAGNDGIIKTMDPETKKIEFCKIDKNPITKIVFNKNEEVIIIGNSRGLLKSYLFINMVNIASFKVFEDAVTNIMVEEKYLIAFSSKNIFVIGIGITGVLTPFYFIEPCISSITNSLLIDHTIIYSTSGGEIYSFSISNPESFNNEKNFLFSDCSDEYYSRLQMMEFQKPKKDEDDIRYYLNDEMEFHDVEWEPTSIRSLEVYKEDEKSKFSRTNFKVIVGAEGNFTGYLYVLEMQKKEKNDPVKSPEKNTAKGSLFESQIIKGSVSEENQELQVVPRPNRAFMTRSRVVSIIKYEKDWCLWGYSDGVISIRFNLDLEKEFIRVRAHNHDCGELRDIQLFSDKFLVSFSTDGTLAVMKTEEGNHEASEKKRPSLKLAITSIPKIIQKRDSIDPAEEAMVAGYSLQKDKIQSFKDHLIKIAKEQREGIMVRIEKLRKNYKQIKEVNRRLPYEVRMPEIELDFDSKYSSEQPEIFEEEIDEIEKELEYDIKVARLRVEKLNRFLMIENTELIFSVSQISGIIKVESFKLKKMTNYMLTGLDQISLLIEGERETDKGDMIDEQEVVPFSDAKNLLTTLNELKKRATENKHKDPYIQFKQKIKEECSSFDTIDKLREYQKQISQEIETLKKNEFGAKEIEDSVEVRNAKNNFGEFMLKASSNFKIDEKNRIDLQKLEAHILLLEKFVCNTKESFNKSLGDLRTQKQKLIEKIMKINEQVAGLNKQIEINEPEIKYKFIIEEEFPESKLKVKESEILEHLAENGVQTKKFEPEKAPENDLEYELLNLKKNAFHKFPDIDVKLRHQDALLRKAGCIFTPENVLNEEKEDETLNEKQKKIYFAQMRKQQESNLSGAVGNILSDLKKVTNEVRTKRKTNIESSRKKNIQNMVHIRLEAKKKMLLSQIKTDMEKFDKEIESMTVERRKAEFELKMAQMRILELFREWLEIQIFEEEDQIMRKELSDKRNQIKDWNEKKISNAISEQETTNKILKLELELHILEDNYREKIFPSEPEKAEFVYRYFSVNYRRNGGPDIEEPDENQLKEFDPNTLDSDKKECVLYFEQNEEWVEVLKKRYETDEALRGFQKAKQSLDIENNKIEDRIRTIQKSLAETKHELDDLQFKKLGRIHRLNCSFILDSDQVYLDCPLTGLDSSVVFTNDQLKKLRGRTSELEEECRKIESERSELYVSQDALVKNLNILRTCKKLAKEELDENFKLKFGEYVNLDILNSLKETKKLKEMKKEYREVDKTSAKRVDDARVSLAKTQEELVELKRKNTEILKRITLLGNAQIRLNKTLDNTNKQIFKDEKDFEAENAQSNKKDLLGIINLLNTELDALKKEIYTLKHK